MPENLYDMSSNISSTSSDIISKYFDNSQNVIEYITQVNKVNEDIIQYNKLVEEENLKYQETMAINESKIIEEPPAQNPDTALENL